MNKIEGKIKNIIYKNDTNGYLVALFRLSKSDNELYLKKTITITGTFLDIKEESKVILEGEFTHHEKYGNQFKVSNYEYVIPAEKDDVLEFLSSKFVKGCGKKTAEKIVGLYGSDAINIIKNDVHALDGLNISSIKKQQIYDSLINYSKSSDLILKLTNMGFSIDEASRIYAKYKYNLQDIINNNIYLLNDVIEFKRLDTIFLNNIDDKYDIRRRKACIIECMKMLSNNTGDVYYNTSDIYSYLNKLFGIDIDYETYLDDIIELCNDYILVKENDNVYLHEYYEEEYIIAYLLKSICDKSTKKVNYDDKISKLESKLNIIYNDDQKRAINEALNNNVTIISGGPGTGKTTIINAIVKLYIEENKLVGPNIFENIALLAPTGRASKKMSTSTGLPASTIHRFLKWNKDTDEFQVNENNKNIQKLIIVDEVSMVDLPLMAALLKGINSYVKLVLVGDAFQLPSVGPGNILADLINSEIFNYIPLNYIYRQSDNSYIPYLAREIKNKDLQEEFTHKHDDYNFLITDNKDILGTIKRIVEVGINKGFNENNLQVLAPMYKGDVGIDNLNRMLCDLFNPLKSQREILYGDVIYKENDKVLQLVNDADNNVFNGDIGFIKRIVNEGNKEYITIDFDGNNVTYLKKDLKNIKHAYAISIHKSQGSEFDHVIIPITYYYGSMLYNKLLYTGVSRAKKSLILIGDASVFYKGVLNDYGNVRKTTLTDRLKEKFYT